MPCPVSGIGPITASAIAATVGDASQFRLAGHFAAWLGFAPKQRQGGISK
ncbi:MAG: IS110 family transposase [Acetobacteraceae bacterium]|nr:IS110 family transposase [Acetobacteraceae bacterium]